MFISPNRIATAALTASLFAAGSAAAAPTSGGVSVHDTVNGKVQVSSPEATPASVGQPADVNAVTASIDAAAAGSVGYAFSITDDGQPVSGGAGGYARRPLDGTQDADGTAFTVDSRIEVALPGVQRLLPTATKGKKGRRALAKLNSSLLVPTGIEPTSCKGKESTTATHIYNAANLSIGGTLIGAATDAACGPARGLMLSAADLTSIAPLLKGATDGATGGGWTTAAGQSDDGSVTWQSGDGRFPGGREVHACLATAGSLSLSIIFNAQIPGGQSPCRILLDATNGSRTAS